MKTKQSKPERRQKPVPKILLTGPVTLYPIDAKPPKLGISLGGVSDLVLVYQYVVLGAGHFPIDLLRLDNAWPARERDSRKIDGDSHKLRKVVLRSLCHPAIYAWKNKRWEVVRETIQVGTRSQFEFGPDPINPIGN